MATPEGRDTLWGITSYFNPQRSRKRLLNYRLFRHYLKIPLVTVELSFGADFDLHAEDADVLISLRGGDILWQKERLLNVARKALPNACRKVVWLDCDTIVAAPDWAKRLSQALDEHLLVQPFSRLGYLAPNAKGQDPMFAGAVERWRPSIAYKIGTGLQAPECLRQPFDRSLGTPGTMWAARRELLDDHGFYDAAIVGGGDFAMTAAAWGCFAEVMERHQMNQRQRQHYRAWAEPYFDAVRGNVSYVDCSIFHLWHGAIANRRYRQRHEGLGGYHFDPYRDLALAQGGAWRWNSDKPLLHQYLKDFFAGRQEDG